MADPEYERILSQLRLAMLNDCACEETLSHAQESARVAGLSAAEIDAALGERSFDVRTSAVLALGCALKNGDLPAYAKAEKYALACGLTHEELAYFMSMARQFVDAKPTSFGLPVRP
ncbi:MAG: hypothetical protein CL955_08495 [Erythrobacteraceae bacterium]|nr:hypothetical protein [Erythrobacteraceae bacterium]